MNKNISVVEMNGMFYVCFDAFMMCCCWLCLSSWFFLVSSSLCTYFARETSTVLEQRTLRRIRKKKEHVGTPSSSPILSGVNKIGVIL